MAIRVPGVKRDKRGRPKATAKRTVVAVLSLTAMVDLFTVLAVFLLQNMASTGEVIHLPKEVILPKAQQVKELKPSNIVTITEDKILLNSTEVDDFIDVKESKDWIAPKLLDGVKAIIKAEKEKAPSLTKKIRKAVNTDGEAKDETEPYLKITIQADKGIDFLSVKKIMYTVTEAGIHEINFAVLKTKSETESL